MQVFVWGCQEQGVSPPGLDAGELGVHAQSNEIVSPNSISLPFVQSDH